MKTKIGIYLQYAPMQPISTEGIGRLLAFIVAGIINQPHLELTIALPYWFKKSLFDLLTDHHIDINKIEFITSNGNPYYLRAIEKRRKRRHDQAPNKYRTYVLKRIKNTLKAASVFLVGQSNLLTFYLLLAVYSLIGIILFPTIMLLAVVYYSLLYTKKVLKIVKKILLKTPIRRFLRFHSLYHAVLNKEIESLIKKINKCEDIKVWYTPCIFWEEATKIKSKLIVGIPDIVMLDFPSQYTTPHFELVYEKMKRIVQSASFAICYSNYVKVNHIQNKLNYDPAKIAVIDHGNIDLLPYLKASKNSSPIKKIALNVLQNYQKKSLQNDPYLRDFDFNNVPFIFYSSQSRHHKNFLNLIKAVELLIRKRYLNIKLITTARFGKDEAVMEYLHEKKLNYDVISLPNISNKVLAALNCLAICAVNPTLFEGGFPFSFSEAYSVGTPSIMSAIPVVLEKITDPGLRETMLFDPYKFKSIANKIEWAIANVDELYQKQQMLYKGIQQRNWKVVADEYIDVFKQVALEKKTCSLITLQPRYKNFVTKPLPQQNLVAVFFDLEFLGKSAIANFSVKTFGPYPEKFHIFTKLSSRTKERQVLEELQQILHVDQEKISIFDGDNYEQMDQLCNYSANIFVLGDSAFNIKSFEYAVALYAHRARNYLYFHDGAYVNLLYCWVKAHQYDWPDFVSHYYPDIIDVNKMTFVNLLKAGIHMIPPLLELTGTTNIIVNADNCIPIINNEVTGPLNIKSAFLPIPDNSDKQLAHLSINSMKKNNTFIVAHFGVPNSLKQLDKLIEATMLLQQVMPKGKKIKLLLAGYGTADYVKELPAKQQKVILIQDSPSEETMLALMKMADITVQLRWPLVGQASAAVNEVLSLGLKCITTKGFVSKLFEKYVIEVMPDISSKQLAEVILTNLNKTAFSAVEHQDLLQSFSYEASANLLFAAATDESTRVVEPNKKLRILYGASHRILRYEEVPLFLAANFEVIPIKTHWEVLKITEPGVDDSTHTLYPKWNKHCTIPYDILQEIQNIDLFSYENLNDLGGKVSPQQAELLNQWVDIIYIPNLLPAVPRILEWFKGLTLFRVYGEGKIMTYDEWAQDSNADLSILKSYDQRYVAMLMLNALNGAEHSNILGSNVFHVGPCVTRKRINGKWKAEDSKAICNITLSYIYSNPHWTEIYYEFNKLFNDIPLQILGKNDKSREPLKSDNRVVGIIDDEQHYLNLLTDCRCFLDVGSSPFHMHYTPIEAMIMGIPVIFLKSSGMAQEIFRVIPFLELDNCGICETFIEAKVIIQKCLDDVNYAKDLVERQKVIIEKMFLPEVVLGQIKEFAKHAPTLLENARCLNESFT